MTTTAARVLEGESLKTVIHRINTVEDIYSFSPQTASVTALPLNFYSMAGLLSVRSSAWQSHEDPLWFVDVKGCDLVNLDGSVAAINQANALAGLALTADNAAAYLKYRLFFKFDNEQRTYLIQNLFDDASLEKDRGLTKELIPHFKPPAVSPCENGFLVQALTCQGDTFYQSEIEVRLDGSISVQKQTPVFSSQNIRSAKFKF